MDNRTKLVGILGATAAAVVLVFVPAKEGRRLTPYYDAVGVLTVCDGSTRDVEMRKYTPQECDERLAEDLVIHAGGAMKCLTKPTTAGQRAAYTSLAFNIGIAAFCGSSVARHHNAGNFKQACASISLWDKAVVNGQLIALPGLTIRRKEERAMCEGRTA